MDILSVIICLVAWALGVATGVVLAHPTYRAATSVRGYRAGMRYVRTFGRGL